MSKAATSHRFVESTLKQIKCLYCSDRETHKVPIKRGGRVYDFYAACVCAPPALKNAIALVEQYKLSCDLADICPLDAKMDKYCKGFTCPKFDKGESHG